MSDRIQNELTIFENTQFGKIRSLLIEGEPWFVAADVCRALEIGNPSDAIKRLDSDEVMTLDLNEGHSGTRGGAQKLNLVNEPGMYALVLGSRKPSAKAFKRWIAHDVIPSIRKTGMYSANLSPAEQLVAQAKMLLEQEKRMAALEDRVAIVAARVETRPEDSYSIAGYASVRGIKVDVNKAAMLGRRAVHLSQQYGYDVSVTPDPRFGKVNIYHSDILKTVFDEALSNGLISRSSKRGAI